MIRTLSVVDEHRRTSKFGHELTRQVVELPGYSASAHGKTCKRTTKFLQPAFDDRFQQDCPLDELTTQTEDKRQS